MKILIDLQHPAHLHFFRPLILRLRQEGHSVKVTGRDKDILVALAKELGMDVEVFGKARPGVLNLGLELLSRQRRLFGVIRSFRPDIILAIAGTFSSFPGRVMGVPVHIFYDTEHATISNMLAYPFAECVHIPKCYRGELKCSHKRYNGYHELAYLHPKYFKPDASVPESLGVRPDEIFTLVRFVGWAAGHDIGLKGLTKEDKIRAVRKLAEKGKVFISSEAVLPMELEEYRLKLDVSRVHHLMAFASLIFGESATMCSEGAVLGVPGIYIDPAGRGYTDEQERDYGLVFNFKPNRQEDALEKAVEILTGYDRASWRKKGEQLRNDKIDVTQMMYDIVIGEHKNS